MHLLIMKQGWKLKAPFKIAMFRTVFMKLKFIFYQVFWWKQFIIQMEKLKIVFLKILMN